MFARMARREGAPAYKEYYGRRPELKRIDDRIRKMPMLGQPGGRYYDSVISPEADRYFEAIREIEPDAGQVASWADSLRAADRPDPIIRQLLLELGAVAVGIAPLERPYIYTNKGRLDEDYGCEIDLDHPHAIVFLVEMDHTEMARAPLAETLRESARQYYRAAEMGMTVEAALKAAGYSAKAHYDAHYDVILPPLAVLAGLGEVGRNNILIADRYGSRVRIGAVTTNAPLEEDRPISLGAGPFCEACQKCAENCPSRALSTGDRERVRGVLRWTTDVERCYGYWRTAGTDCGICMAVCPFSHQNNWFHNLVRGIIRRAPRTARFFLMCDDLTYGREWRSGGAGH